MIKRGLLVLQALLLVVLLGPTLGRAAVRNATFTQLARYFAAPTEAQSTLALERAAYYASYLTEEDGAHYAQYRERVESALAQTTSPALRQYRLGREAMAQAEEAEVNSQFEEALSHYRRAYENGSEQVRLEALLSMARVEQARGNQSAAEQALNDAHAATPPDALIRQDVCPGWRLDGVYVDRLDVQFNAPVHVLLVWERTDAGAAMQTEPRLTMNRNLVTWKNKMFQMERVHNLLPDGGFSSVASPGPGLPMGFKPLFSSQTLADTTFELDASAPERGVYLHMQGLTGNSVGIGSAAFPIPSTEAPLAYLLGVTFRSATDSRPRIGAYWQFPHAKSVNDNKTDYAVKQPSTEWKRRTYLTVPPPGADEVSFWAMETQSPAFLDVDNLFLLPTPLHCLQSDEINES